MLEKCFDSSPGGLLRVRSLREGVHGALLDSFSAALLNSRYANITTRRHLRAAEHFANWANSHSIAVPQWNDSLWVANWQLWHKSPLWCSLAQIGRVSRRDCTSGFSQVGSRTGAPV